MPSIVPYVKACEDAGADALSMINTIPAMVIDIEKRMPVLANVTGGLSGRGIHPAAVKLVYDAHKATKLPILAMGGVYEPKDAVEFFLAGATAVAVGTATFSNPGVVAEIYDGVVAWHSWRRSEGSSERMRRPRRGSRLGVQGSKWRRSEGPSEWIRRIRRGSVRRSLRTPP